MRIPRYALSRLQNLSSFSRARLPLASNCNHSHKDARLHQLNFFSVSVPIYWNASRGFHVCRKVIVFNKSRTEPESSGAKIKNSGTGADEDTPRKEQDKTNSQVVTSTTTPFREESEQEREQRRIDEAYDKEEESKEREYTTEDRKRDYRKKYTVNTAIITRDFFENLKKKNKDTFLASIDVFITRDKYLRGHVEFIYAALKHMKEFGVHKDLEAYKKLFDVFPKGKMVAQSIWQIEFMHYPKQQFCAIDVLEQMEDNGVMGDAEVEDMLDNIFGSKSFPSRKHGRMMYWMPKFKNLSPWYLPDPLPDDCLELVKLAIQRITSVDLQTLITIYKAEDLEDAVDHTWIVSGQSPDQQALIESHPADRPIYVEGAFRVWLRDQCINYFILRSAPLTPPKKDSETDPDDVGVLHHVFNEDYKEKAVIPFPTVHEQEDGIILGCCATGTSSRDSVVSWIRFLQDSNPRLGKDISVIFTLKSPIGPTDNLDDISLGGEETKQEALREKEKDSGLIGQGLGFDPIRPELEQVGVEGLSDTRFVNWPHHFNRKQQVYEEDNERISDSRGNSRTGVESNENSNDINKKLM